MVAGGLPSGSLASLPAGSPGDLGHQLRLWLQPVLASQPDSLPTDCVILQKGLCALGLSFLICEMGHRGPYFLGKMRGANICCGLSKSRQLLLRDGGGSGLETPA